MKKLILSSALLGLAALIPAQAADYIVDYKGAHASVNFKVKHMGFSWLTGRFNKFSGKFNYDENDISSSKINITITTSSVDSNHAERDKHLKSDDFLDVSKFPTATFVSSNIEDKGNGKLAITGDFTLQNIKKEIVIDAVKVGEGDDPWGGYRVGFNGTTSIKMSDFGYKMDFGDILFDLHLEGVRQ